MHLISSAVSYKFQNNYKEDLAQRLQENLKRNAEFFAQLGINEVNKIKK